MQIAELKAGISHIEQKLGRKNTLHVEAQQPTGFFTIAGLGTTELVEFVLRGSGAVMTIDDVYDALRTVGRTETREAVSNALAYLARKQRADKVARGKYIKR